MSPFFYAQNASLTHNFRGKPGTTLAIIKVQNSMEQHHEERKRKSSSGKSPFGNTALNGRSPSASAPSLINSSHKITTLTHNFRGKPGTTLAIIPAQNSMVQHHEERKRKGKSSSGKSPIGRQASNRHIPSASALSLINFITKERRPHKLHYFVVHCSNKFSTCSICGFRKVRKIIGWDTKDRGDINK